MTRRKKFTSYITEWMVYSKIVNNNVSGYAFWRIT